MSTPKKSPDGLAGLAAFLPDSRRVSVGGQLYDLGKLRPIDLAAARSHVVACRIRRHVDTTQGMPFEPEVRAKILAEIECHPLPLHVVMQDPDGRIKLIHLALARAGNEQSMLKLQQNLDPIMQNELYAYVLWVSGIIPDPILGVEKSGENPTEGGTTASTGT